MTVKGQKNHYNVKLLKGYGVSINLRDNRICLKGGRDPFTAKQETEEWFVTQIPYERIIISGKGYLSTEAVKLLTEHNINIILTDTYGNLITAMHQIMSSPTATRYRMAQYDTFRNPEKVAYLQKQTMKSKLESQIQFLQSLQRPEVQEAIDGLASYATTVKNAKDKRDLLTIESRAGHLYFRNYAKLFDYDLMDLLGVRQEIQQSTALHLGKSYPIFFRPNTFQRLVKAALAACNDKDESFRLSLPFALMEIIYSKVERQKPNISPEIDEIMLTDTRRAVAWAKLYAAKAGTGDSLGYHRALGYTFRPIHPTRWYDDEIKHYGRIL